MLGDSQVMRHYPAPLTREESLGWIERQRARYARDGHGLWLVLERETGRPVGQVGLALQTLDDWPSSPVHEIGYLLHRAHWGRGFATEAASAVRDYAFHEHDQREVVSLIRAANEPSRAVARRIGMDILGETTHAGLPHLVYGVAREQMPGARSHG